MKKLFCMLLATVMLFSLCTVSVFADEFTTNAPYGDEDYYVSRTELDADGWVRFDSTPGSTIHYGVTITNLLNYRITYGYNMQCVVVYDDETYDLDSTNTSLTLAANEQKNGASMLFPYSDKTIVYIDAEFHVSSSGYEKWMGYIGQTLTLGINA